MGGGGAAYWTPPPPPGIITKKTEPFMKIFSPTTKHKFPKNMPIAKFVLTFNKKNSAIII